MPLVDHRSSVLEPQMSHGSNNKLVLIVDDTPTNVGVISGVLKGAYRTKVATNGEKAREAQNQADELLHALLPKKAADEIRSIGTVIPRRYENVAVLFCDVTNFTSYCDKHEPEDVVSRLDALFVIFERVTARHGLEKIKTIGDGFMAAAGLLHKVNDPGGAAVRC